MDSSNANKIANQILSNTLNRPSPKPDTEAIKSIGNIGDIPLNFGITRRLLERNTNQIGLVDLKTRTINKMDQATLLDDAKRQALLDDYNAQVKSKFKDSFNDPVWLALYESSRNEIQSTLINKYRTFNSDLLTSVLTQESSPYTTLQIIDPNSPTRKEIDTIGKNTGLSQSILDQRMNKTLFNWLSNDYEKGNSFNIDIKSLPLPDDDKRRLIAKRNLMIQGTLGKVRTDALVEDISLTFPKFQGSADEIITKATTVLNDPNATDKDKQDASTVLDSLRFNYNGIKKLLEDGNVSTAVLNHTGYTLTPQIIGSPSFDSVKATEDRKRTIETAREVKYNNIFGLLYSDSKISEIKTAISVDPSKVSIIASQEGEISRNLLRDGTINQDELIRHTQNIALKIHPVVGFYTILEANDEKSYFDSLSQQNKDSIITRLVNAPTLQGILDAQKDFYRFSNINNVAFDAQGNPTVNTYFSELYSRGANNTLGDVDVQTNAISSYQEATKTNKAVNARNVEIVTNIFERSGILTLIKKHWKTGAIIGAGAVLGTAFAGPAGTVVGGALSRFVSSNPRIAKVVGGMIGTAIGGIIGNANTKDDNRLTYINRPDLNEASPNQLNADFSTRTLATSSNASVAQSYAFNQFIFRDQNNITGGFMDNYTTTDLQPVINLFPSDVAGTAKYDRNTGTLTVGNNKYTLHQLRHSSIINNHFNLIDSNGNVVVSDISLPKKSYEKGHNVSQQDDATMAGLQMVGILGRLVSGSSIHPASPHNIGILPFPTNPRLPSGSNFPQIPSPNVRTGIPSPNTPAGLPSPQSLTPIEAPPTQLQITGTVSPPPLPPQQQITATIPSSGVIEQHPLVIPQSAPQPSVILQPEPTNTQQSFGFDIPIRPTKPKKSTKKKN